MCDSRYSSLWIGCGMVGLLCLASQFRMPGEQDHSTHTHHHKTRAHHAGGEPDPEMVTRALFVWWTGYVETSTSGATSRSQVHVQVHRVSWSLRVVVFLRIPAKPNPPGGFLFPGPSSSFSPNPLQKPSEGLGSTLAGVKTREFLGAMSSLPKPSSFPQVSLARARFHSPMPAASRSACPSMCLHDVPRLDHPAPCTPSPMLAR